MRVQLIRSAQKTVKVRGLLLLGVQDPSNQCLLQ
jgi:hypothetical protein